MQSKFANKCIVCGNIVEVGTTIQWQKGTGIKHHPPCEDPDEGFQEDKSELIIIDEKEWVDFQKYSRKELLQIHNCQCCGKPLKGGDTWINVDRKTCEGCFLK